MDYKYDPEDWPLGCSWVYPREQRVSKRLKVMVIAAHPDDADLLTGGLTLKLTKRGHKVKYLAITNGNLGHYKINPIELAEIRRKEAERSAAILGAEYESLNIDDGYVFPNREQTEKLVRAIRQFDPDMIITHRPVDYHRDHRYTGQLVMDASYMLIVPHYCPETPISKRREMPVICYAYDHFEEPRILKPNVMLDIEEEYDTKAEACIQHESQMMDWLPWTLKQEDMIPPDYDKENQLQIFEMMLMSVFSGVIRDYKKKKKKGFPDKKVRKAEIFEICPYGRQPTAKELKELFPGAYVPSNRDLKEFFEGKLKK